MKEMNEIDIRLMAVREARQVPYVTPSNLLAVADRIYKFLVLKGDRQEIECSMETVNEIFKENFKKHNMLQKVIYHEGETDAVPSEKKSETPAAQPAGGDCVSGECLDTTENGCGSGPHHSPNAGDTQEGGEGADGGGDSEGIRRAVVDDVRSSEYIRDNGQGHTVGGGAVKLTAGQQGVLDVMNELAERSLLPARPTKILDFMPGFQGSTSLYSHLKALVESGLIVKKEVGPREVYYDLAPDPEDD